MNFVGVNVVHEDLVPVLVGELVAQVDHTTCERSSEVLVGTDSLDVEIGVGVVVLASLALVTAAKGNVVDVGDDAGGNEALAVVIEVDSPLVGAAFCKEFVDVSGRMVTPDGGTGGDAFRIWSARFTDFGAVEDALAAI